MIPKDEMPAFPVPSPCFDHQDFGELIGVSRREYIATKMAASLVPDYCHWMRTVRSTRTGFDDTVPGDADLTFAQCLAEEAVFIADALLEQLTKEKGGAA